MADQVRSEQSATSDLRSALQALLQENLGEQELRERLQALVAPAGASRQPTTDEATDHPGYQ